MLTMIRSYYAHPCNKLLSYSLRFIAYKSINKHLFTLQNRKQYICPNSILYRYLTSYISILSSPGFDKYTGIGHFGPYHFGPYHFGPFSNRHFGPSSRHFGPSWKDTSAPSKRHFGPSWKTLRPLIFRGLPLLPLGKIFF